MPTATASDHQVKIQPRAGVNSAAPTTPNFVQLLETALAGGDPVYDFFAGHFQALQGLYQTIATGGDDVWLDGVDNETNMPVKYVAQGNNFLSVSTSFTDTQPMKDGTGDKATYKPVGVSYVTLTTDQGTSQMILNEVHYAGLGLGGLMTAPVLGKFALSIVKSVATWIKNLAVKIWQRVTGGGGAEDPEAAEETVESDAADAADEAGEAGVEVASGIFADVAITVAQGVFFVVGIGVLAVVFILQLLSKQISAHMRFYNLTATDIEFGICKVDDHTEMSGGPATVGETASVSKVSKATAPPWVTGSDTGIYYADADFLNSNVLYGVGYVLTASQAGDFPGFKIAVEIPSTMPNSLYAAFTTDSCDQVWDQFNDPDNPASTELTATATSGSYTLRVATNANHGQTPSPLSGDVGYNYEHLVVLSDGSVKP
jgi:hypothetical protein